MLNRTPLAGTQSRLARLPVPTLLAAALMAAFGAAHAQTADTTTDQSLERVTVTGSNLRRTDTETPSPVQVITAEDIRNSGYTDISDVLHNLSADGAGSLSQGFGGAFAAGASGIALRGLTVGATLTLIDGHRMAPYALSDDGERAFVDVSQIPLEAIDRIEILKDGASSIYGSDAIAGVVNIILKKNYTGSEITGDFGISNSADGRMRHVAGITGWGDLDADGHNAYIAVEYRESDPVLTQDRPYLDPVGNYSNLLGGTNHIPGVPTPQNSGLAGSTTGYFVPYGTSTISGFLPGCNATLYNAGGCSYNINNQYLQPPTQNISVVGSYNQVLPAGFQLDLKASIFNEKSNTTNPQPSTAIGGPTLVGIGPGQTPVVNGPFLPLVAPNYPGNPYAGGESLLNATFGTIYPTTSTDSTTYRFAADLTGTVYGFDTNLSFGYSQNNIYSDYSGVVNYGALDAALCPVKSAAGVCVSSVSSTGQVFYVGNQFFKNTAAQIAAVFPQTSSLATDKLIYLTGGASRDVFTLPGGPLNVGVGFDYRHQDLDAVAPYLASSGQVGYNNEYAVGTQSVAAVYGEVAAPIFKFLEIDASVRHDAYAGSFSDTTPKIGFTLKPISQVEFRGTYAEGFRAPNPAEEGQAGESFGANDYTDPVLCGNPGGKTGAGNFPSACAFPVGSIQVPGTNLQPEKSRSYTGGFILEPIKGYSVSLDYYDIKINNQIVSAFEDPFYSGSTPVRGPQQVLPYNVPDPAAPGGYVVGAALTPVGPVAYFPYPYINAAYTHTDGVDLDARAKVDMGSYGKITADLTETHVFQYQQAFAGGTGPVELAGTHGPTGVSGDTGNPKDRAQFSLTYDRGPLSVTASTNWTGTYSVLDPSAGLTNCALALYYSAQGIFNANFGTYPSQYCRVHSSTSENLYIAYKLTKQWSLHGSVLNLFNQSAPADYQSYGGGSNGLYSPYSPNWSEQQAIGRYFTVGATYKF